MATIVLYLICIHICIYLSTRFISKYYLFIRKYRIDTDIVLCMRIIYSIRLSVTSLSIILRCISTVWKHGCMHAYHV